MSKFKSGRASRAIGIGLSITKAATYMGLSKIAQKSNSAKEYSRKVMAAKEVIKSMGDLKGALMKLGQMLSLTEDLIIPAEISALFQTLQRDSKRMSQKDIDSVFISDFGDSPQNLFQGFEDVAIAAASIGQVHRAWLEDGTIVAVKVQYPAIEDAIRADFKNLDKLHDLVSIIVPGKPDIRELLEELRRTLINECDYLQEAQSMNRFREDYEGVFANVTIPKVFERFSSQHILTTQYVEGLTFEQAKELPQYERDIICQTLYDMHMFGLYEKRLLHTDPQNGNYLFGPGEVILLDFGSTKEFSEDFIRCYVKLLHAVEVSDIASYEKYARELGLFMPSDDSDLILRHYEMIQKLYIPYTQPGRYRVPPHNPFDLLRDFLNTTSLKGRKGPREEFLLLDRANLGFYAKIRQLGGVIDWTTSRDKYRAKWID